MAYTDRARAALVVRIGPADVGRRVSVRERLADGPTMSDTVGRLEGWEQATLRIRRRDGTLAEVAEQRLVAGKVVPPEVSAYDVQLVAQAGWPPERQAELGGWTLRWAHGGSGRANSVRVGGDPGLPLPDALAYVRDWYAELATPPELQVPMPWTRDADLTALGWREDRVLLVMTAPVAAVAAAGGVTGRAPAGTVLEATGAPDDEWLAVLGDPPAASRPVLRAILTRPDRAVFVAVRDGATGGLLGVGRASAARLRDGRATWAGITSVETVPAARGRGVGSAVLAALAAWAGEAGATTAYLQLHPDNVPARTLYERLGFALHHRYRYLVPG